jgi:D-alanine-D-alanine ligase
MSARSVLSVLDPEKYTVTPIGITLEGQWVVGEDLLTYLQQHKTTHLTPVTFLPEPHGTSATLYTRQVSTSGIQFSPFAELDVIFPVMHGTYSEDGTLQGLLELADIAYVGSGVLASSVGMDKGLFKDVMRANRLPVLDSIVVNRRQIQTQTEDIIRRAEQMAGYPLFVKPANLGSSVGITKCHGRADLVEGLLEAARYDRRILVEQGLESPREVELSVLGNDDPQVSIPGEVVPRADFYTYAAKYLDTGSELLIPARLEPEAIARLQELARRAYKAIDGAGMARVDFLLEKETGKAYISEINTIPGFTQISMYPKLWAASDVPYPALIDRLIELALERKHDRDRTERKFEIPRKSGDKGDSLYE